MLHFPLFISKTKSIKVITFDLKSILNISSFVDSIWFINNIERSILLKKIVNIININILCILLLIVYYLKMYLVLTTYTNVFCV